MLSIEEVKTHPQLWEFLKVPEVVYNGNNAWAEPILESHADFFDKKNPFWQHAVNKLWTVKGNDKPIGRIAAIINKKYIDYAHEATGYFAFFECINNPAAIKKLFLAAKKWLKLNKIKTMRGPINGSLAMECGFLTKGFQETEAPLMTYSPKYYLTHMKKLGFKKSHDLDAYTINIAQAPELDHENDLDLKIRSINRFRLKKDVEKINNLINDAMSHTNHWQFTPRPFQDFYFLVKDLRFLLIPDLILIAEHNNHPVGCIVAYPNFNLLTKKFRGSMTAAKLVSLLLEKRNIKEAKLDIIAVSHYYSHRGVGKLLMQRILKILREKKFSKVEYSWVLDDNKASRHLAEELGGKVTKSYRIFEKSI